LTTWYLNETFYGQRIIANLNVPDARSALHNEIFICSFIDIFADSSVWVPQEVGTKASANPGTWFK